MCTDSITVPVLDWQGENIFMIRLRKSSDRGKAEFGGLVSYHSFSFGDYYDPAQMGFRALRVINDDVLQGGFGFPPHPHRDMEIVTYLIEGALEHKDSMGNKEVIRPGEVQRMTAGSGVTHSEYNHSKTDQAHLLQIWIVPAERGLPPGYEQKSVGAVAHGLQKVASNTEDGDALHIHQDATIYVAKLTQGTELPLPLSGKRYGWVQVISGELSLEGTHAGPGDGLGISNEERPVLKAASDTHFMLFDLA